MDNEELAQDILRCKAKVYEDLRNQTEAITHLEARMDTFEANQIGTKKTLLEHEEQRKSFAEDIILRVDGLKEWFSIHDTKEMTKYDEIIKAIGNLSKSLNHVIEDTEKNTSFNDKLKKYWFGISMTLSGLTVFGGSIWWLVLEMEERGMLILFPSTQG